VQPHEHIEARRQSFGAIAGDYARFRPGPPAEAVRWLLPAAAADVLEIGSGTGALTTMLTERAGHVRAVEPDARMRAVLRDRVSEAEVVAGRAEELPADDASFDVVIGASMWHWVDEEVALAEVARVLRPGGTLALLWSGTDRSIDWMRSLWSGGLALTTEQVERADADRRDRHTVHLGPHSPFHQPQVRVIRWSRAMTKEELVGLAGTYSEIITMDPVDRQDYLAALARFIDTQPVPWSDGAVDVPMRCRCWRTTLR
jgi:SAM-dependent methyltransferase